MARTVVRWNSDIVEKIRDKHGLTTSEVEDVLLDDTLPTTVSNSVPHRPCKFGYTSTGKHIIVVWVVLQVEPEVLLPVTAYPVSVPKRRRR